jgi:hypothetical protein
MRTIEQRKIQEHNEKWYDLYCVSNWLNNRELMSDCYFWFLARREDYNFEECRELLEQLYREEVGVPMGEECETWNTLRKHA